MEIIAECPEELAELVKFNLQECMERAGAIYCKRVKLKAEPSIVNCWQK